MRPVASWIVAKLALPITRLSIIRPATLTGIGVAPRTSGAVSPWAASRSAARSAGLKSFGKATPLPSLCAARKALSFSRRSAINWLSSAAGAAVAGAAGAAGTEGIRWSDMDGEEGARPEARGTYHFIAPLQREIRTAVSRTRVRERGQKGPLTSDSGARQQVADQFEPHQRD